MPVTNLLSNISHNLPHNLSKPYQKHLFAYHETRYQRGGMNEISGYLLPTDQKVSGLNPDAVTKNLTEM
jgi:hypothetical protein